MASVQGTSANILSKAWEKEFIFTYFLNFERVGNAGSEKVHC